MSASRIPRLFEERRALQNNRTVDRFDLRPARWRLVDCLLLFALGVTALAGLHSTYSSWWFLAAGSFGLVLGMALAYFVITRNQPALVLAAGSCVAYFALGSLVTATTGGGVVPTPAVLRQLAHELGFGWKELLTTLPPVASTGPLLALLAALMFLFMFMARRGEG